MKLPLSTLLLSLFICGIFGQTFVPLVPVINSTIALDTGAFTPNGTLSPGQYMQFYTNVQSVSSKYGLSVYVKSINGQNGAPFVNMTLYLKQGQQALAYMYDQKLAVNCLGPPCTYWVFQPTFGECNPDNGVWYFSVLNTGLDSLTFQLEVDIDIWGGGTLECDFGQDVGNALAEFFIILFSIIGAIIVGLIICAAVCCYLGNRSRRYQHIPDTCTTTTVVCAQPRVAQVHYAQAPQYTPAPQYQAAQYPAAYPAQAPQYAPAQQFTPTQYPPALYPPPSPYPPAYPPQK